MQKLTFKSYFFKHFFILLALPKALPDIIKLINLKITWKKSNKLQTKPRQQ